VVAAIAKPLTYTRPITALHEHRKTRKPSLVHVFVNPNVVSQFVEVDLAMIDYTTGMHEADKPSNESARLKFLKELAILDTPCESVFDRIVFTTAQLFRVPISTLTLVDAERQWFKSGVGVTTQETPRNVAFCAHTILQEEELIVENALDDPRFLGNPFVTGAPNIRFYIGMPLITPERLIIGSLCAMDVVPRSPSSGQISVMRQLARKATNILCDDSRVKARLSER
jgi:hypothetical protein